MTRSGGACIDRAMAAQVVGVGSRITPKPIRKAFKVLVYIGFNIIRTAERPPASFTAVCGSTNLFDSLEPWPDVGSQDF